MLNLEDSAEHPALGAKLIFLNFSGVIIRTHGFLAKRASALMLNIFPYRSMLTLLSVIREFQTFRDMTRLAQ